MYHVSYANIKTQRISLTYAHIPVYNSKSIFIQSYDQNC